MNKTLILCAALTLAGCSSKPSSGDLENILEPLVEKCTNLSITDVKKTNGMPNDELYQVEYTYTVEVDEDKLGALKQELMPIVENSVRLSNRSAELQRKASAVSNEIYQNRRVYAIPRPPRNDMDSDQYAPIEAAWIAQRDAGNTDLLSQEALLKQEIAEVENELHSGPKMSPDSANYRLQEFLFAGCAHESMSYLIPIRNHPAARTLQAFDIVGYPLQGSMTLAKTEQGWLPRR